MVADVAVVEPHARGIGDHVRREHLRGDDRKNIPSLAANQHAIAVPMRRKSESGISQYIEHNPCSSSLRRKEVDRDRSTPAGELHEGNYGDDSIIFAA